MSDNEDGSVDDGYIEDEKDIMDEEDEPSVKQKDSDKDVLKKLPRVMNPTTMMRRQLQTTTKDHKFLPRWMFTQKPIRPE
jgi:hypothetical protein